jgi:acyl-CoA dehydrogenase
MDVHGGKGICMGPGNYLARGYQQQPIAITVEGANILTRSMIIFGQGAIRGHPYVLKEIAASGDPEPDRAGREFDEAFFGHLLFVASNAVRAFWLGLTGARLLLAPGDRHMRRYFQKITRLSAAFAFMADVAMLTLGGALKRRERLSARLGDILSELYLACAALKLYSDRGRPQEDLPLLHWSVRDALHRAEEAFYGLFANLPNPVVAWIMKHLLFPYGRRFPPPSDGLGHRVVGLLLEPTGARKRLTAGMFVSKDENDPVAGLESALLAVIDAEPIGAKIRTAREQGEIAGRFPEEIIDEAVTKGVITAEEKMVMERARRLRRKAIMVDDFPQDLGRTEIYQTTQPVTTEALHGRIQS